MTSYIPVKAVVFLVVMYGCESWTIKKAKCWISDAFELWCWRRLLSPLDSKEVKPVYPKGNQSWIFIVRTDAEAEAPIFWPPDMKNWLIGKDPDAGKDWRQEKGMAENEMVGWHHRLDGHEFEQALGVGDGQGSLVCCSPWVKHDWAIELKWASLSKFCNILMIKYFIYFGKKTKISLVFGLMYLRETASVVIQSLSRVQLFATSWTAASQFSLSLTISQSLFKLMSIESVMLPHLILCLTLLLLSSIFPSIRVFSISQSFASGGQTTGASASASVLPMNIQGWFPLGLTGLISLQSKGLSRVFSSTTILKHQFLRETIDQILGRFYYLKEKLITFQLLLFSFRFFKEALLLCCRQHF